MKAPEIKIGIQSEREIRFRLNGSYSDIHAGCFPGGDYVACIKDNSILMIYNGKEWRQDNFQLFPDDFSKADFLLEAVTIGINFHWEKKEAQVFKGALHLFVTGERIQVVNLLPVEDYLISVISSEMSATSSLELLKAHAVISRGWVLAQIGKSREFKPAGKTMEESDGNEIIRWYDREDHELFDVCADDHCQRYQGITRACTQTVIEAVCKTSGEVLTFDGKLCDTRFSKCCGGVTELFENTWEPVHHPYLTRVMDGTDSQDRLSGDLTKEAAAKDWIMRKPEAFCNTDDREILQQVLVDYDQDTHDFFRWKVSYEATELAALIETRTGIDFGIIHDLIPLQRGVSGRIMRLKIIGSLKTLIIGKELEIRKTLSKTHLFSSAFVVGKSINSGGSRFTLFGAGWGHGVGLCQIGAAVMGARGFSYREILAHYYKGTTLEKRY